MYITVERSDGPLKKQVWRFYYFDSEHSLVLDSYGVLALPTKRHKKWNILSNYARLYERNSDVKVADVPLPYDVLAEVRRKFTETLKIERELIR